MKVREELKAEKMAIAERNKEVHKKSHEKEELLSKNSELELEIRKRDYDVKQAQEKIKILWNKVVWA